MNLWFKRCGDLFLEASGIWWRNCLAEEFNNSTYLRFLSKDKKKRFSQIPKCKS